MLGSPEILGFVPRNQTQHANVMTRNQIHAWRDGGGPSGLGSNPSSVNVYGLESNLAFLGLRVLICKMGPVRPT